MNGEPPIVRVLLAPVATQDAFGTGYKHRASRLILNTDGVLRKLCWVVLELDGSVSVGLSDPTVVVEDVGRSYSDSAGRLMDDRGPTIADVSLLARTNPHVTLHRSGVCHIRAREHAPLATVTYGEWCPPAEELEWLYLYSDRVDLLPVVREPRQRDAVAPFPNSGDSAVVRVDLLPRTGNTYPLIDGSLHTVLGLAPEYAARITLFRHQPVKRRLLVRDHGKTRVAG